jgi:hypothetical protein
MNILHQLSRTSVLAVVSREITRLFGSVRNKEKFGLINRAHYAYSMLRAADVALMVGKKRVTVCEFGVAAGAGLLNMCEIAEILTTETGITFDIFGFDTGEGIPDVSTYKDHPELWSKGDFPMTDHNALREKINGRATLILGDIKETIGEFISSLSADSPIGCLAIDVDVYTGSVSALKVLNIENPNLLLPAVGVYLDDTRFYFANQWCGELAAVNEFNESNELRKIDIDRSLPGDRPLRQSNFYQQMYVAHILDHPLRQNSQNRTPLTIEQHYAFMKLKNM